MARRVAAGPAPARRRARPCQQFKKAESKVEFCHDEMRKLMSFLHNGRPEEPTRRAICSPRQWSPRRGMDQQRLLRQRRPTRQREIKTGRQPPLRR